MRIVGGRRARQRTGDAEDRADVAPGMRRRSLRKPESSRACSCDGTGNVVGDRSALFVAGTLASKPTRRALCTQGDGIVKSERRHVDRAKVQTSRGHRASPLSGDTRIRHGRHSRAGRASSQTKGKLSSSESGSCRLGTLAICTWPRCGQPRAGRSQRRHGGSGDDRCRTAASGWDGRSPRGRQGLVEGGQEVAGTSRQLKGSIRRSTTGGSRRSAARARLSRKVAAATSIWGEIMPAMACTRPTPVATA